MQSYFIRQIMINIFAALLISRAKMPAHTIKLCEHLFIKGRIIISSASTEFECPEIA